MDLRFIMCEHNVTNYVTNIIQNQNQTIHNAKVNNDNENFTIIIESLHRY